MEKVEVVWISVATMEAVWVSVATMDPWEAREVGPPDLSVADWTWCPEAGVDGQMRGTRGCPRMHKRGCRSEKLGETVMAPSRKRAEGRRLR